MYKVRPNGINIKDNEYNVADGFLKESINLQWKDGAYRPIPERLTTMSRLNSSINGQRMILHKVSDEDQVNVLTIGDNGYLYWYKTIVDGQYIGSTTKFITGFPQITDIDSLSFTILNGLIYFMSVSQEFYYRLQYNETNDSYELKDMYAWKTLIPFYPQLTEYNLSLPISRGTSLMATVCGLILYRFTLVLKTGEEVLHSPIYMSYLNSLNVQSTAFKKDDPLNNISTLVNLDLIFEDTGLLEEEVSAINVYASEPYYQTKTERDFVANLKFYRLLIDNAIVKSEVQRLAESPFYLVKTLNNIVAGVVPEYILFYAGEFDQEINIIYEQVTYINTDTIASGQVMPVDNFSYHKIFGKISSNNGRLIITAPKTVLSTGHIQSLSIAQNVSRVGFFIETEDGDLSGVGYRIESEVEISGSETTFRGLLSYPDSRATYVGGNTLSSDPVGLFKLRSNNAHNLACNFEFKSTAITIPVIAIGAVNYTVLFGANNKITYGVPEITQVVDVDVEPLKYTSGNRLQFSESGEFSVWPALNSYRVGEGKIMFSGSNSIDPANTDYISPLLIGTTDGIYTVNFDPTGANLIKTITRAANLPAISSNNLSIDQNLIYVSDKGLIIINNGRVINITENYFPEQGNGEFPSDIDVYPNYDLLVPNEFSGGAFILDDIIKYMKGALFAYDGRRNNVWCSNPSESFSLIYNLGTKMWTMSTYVFSEVIDYRAIINNIFSRFFTRSKAGDTIEILSGEDQDTKVLTHLLTRGIKMQRPDEYKKIQRLIARCELYRDDDDGYFTLGVWGKQDLNKTKINIPLVAYKDDSAEAFGFQYNVRQDIPVGRMKGKYKIITILQGGLILPSSSLNNFEITAIPVENNILR